MRVNAYDRDQCGVAIARSDKQSSADMMEMLPVRCNYNSGMALLHLEWIGKK